MSIYRKLLYSVFLLIVVAASIYGLFYLMFALSKSEVLPAQAQASSALHFDSLEPALAELPEVYQRWYGDEQTVLDDPASLKLLCDWQNLLALGASQADNYPEALSIFHQNAMDLAMAKSIQFLYWLYRQAYRDFLDSIEKPQPTRQALLERCLSEYPDLHANFDAPLKDFIELAKREKLADENGQLKQETLPIVALLFRALWLNALKDQFPIHVLRSPEEALVHFRWKIEHSQLAPQEKLNILRSEGAEFAQRYDLTLAEAILESKLGNVEQACQLLKIRLQNETLPKAQQKRYQTALHALYRIDAKHCPLS